MRHAHNNNNNNNNNNNRKIDSVQAERCKRLFIKILAKVTTKKILNFVVKVLSWATATARNRNKNDSFSHIKHRAAAVGGESLVH